MKFWVVGLFEIQADSPTHAADVLRCWREDPYAIKRLVDVVVMAEEVSDEEKLPEEKELPPGV